MTGNYESLTKLAQEIERLETVKADYLVPSKDLEMIEDNFIHFGTKAEFKIEDNFHSQLASKLDIPKKYYDRMSSIPGLRTANVNAWLKNRTERNMVRTLEGKARAFLTDKFKPLDHFLILQAFFPVIKDMHVEIKSSSLTPTNMYIQMVFPKLEGEVKQGDVVQAGVVLTNSETGQGSVDISTVIWRLKCLNGMIGESLLHKYHTGRRIGNAEEDYSFYKEDTIQAELKSFQLRFRDIFSHAISESYFQDQLLKMRKAAGIEVKDPIATIEEVTKQYYFSEEETKKLSNNFFNEEKTVWGLANSITALAHEIENPDRQYQYEEIGNQIILNPTQWEKVA